MVGTRKDNMARRGLLTSPIKSESKSDGNQSGSARNPVALGGSEQLGHTFKHGIVKHAFGSDAPELSLSDHLDRGSDALSSSSGDQIMKTFRGFFHEQQRVLESRALKSQERHATQKIDHRVRAASEKVDDTISTFQDRILAACNAQLAETEKLERELMSSVKMLQDIVYHGSRRGMKLKRVTQGIHENCVRSVRASKAQLRDRQKHLITRLGKEDGRAKRCLKLERQRLHALKSVADLLN